MILKFLGRGSGFFPEEGNTAAFFIEDKTLFLIDCGELIFSKIKEIQLLEKSQIEEIYCFVTHLHSDHIGSLGTLTAACVYRANPPIHFHVVCHDALRSDIASLLRIQGCKDLYDFVPPTSLRGEYQSFNEVNFIPTAHTKSLQAFSLEFISDTGKTFYSGDTNDVDLIQEYIKQGDAIEDMYIEVTSYDGPDNAHIPLRALHELIPYSMRYKTHLMHFNNSDCITEARKLGFQIVKCAK